MYARINYIRCFFQAPFFSLCVIRLYVIHFIHFASENERICLFQQKADFTFATEKCKDSGKGAGRPKLSGKSTCIRLEKAVILHSKQKSIKL